MARTNLHLHHEPGGWIDVSARAARHGLAGRVEISNAAWMMAVYFVSETADRNDPERENWRLGRMLVELAVALSQHRDPDGGSSRDFEFSLPQVFDAVRGLTLPCAHLAVHVQPGIPVASIRIDVATGLSRPLHRFTELAA